MVFRRPEKPKAIGGARGDGEETRTTTTTTESRERAFFSSPPPLRGGPFLSNQEFPSDAILYRPAKIYDRHRDSRILGNNSIVARDCHRVPPVKITSRAPSLPTPL